MARQRGEQVNEATAQDWNGGPNQAHHDEIGEAFDLVPPEPFDDVVNHAISIGWLLKNFRALFPQSPGR